MSTLVDKIWQEHVVAAGNEDEGDLIYIDMHLVQEVSSPQAFSGLSAKARKVRRPDLTLAMEDHNISTRTTEIESFELNSRLQVARLRDNCEEFGIELYSAGDESQGIVHVVGPQLGLSQPGMTIVCGDSHTSTHGAFGALAFGIGTSQVEHVLATQSVRAAPFKTLGIELTGTLAADVSAKDVILHIIAAIGISGGRGYVIEYFGEAISALSMEARMTICNMSIEAGARAGLIAPDEKTFAYLRERLDTSDHEFSQMKEYWAQWFTDSSSDYDRVISIDATSIAPTVTWGTNPGQSVGIRGVVPDAAAFTDPEAAASGTAALEYMDLLPGRAMKDISIDVAFIGSCTNGRIEDLRAAAQVIAGRRVAETVRMLIVPGSERVRLQAEAEGLHHIFIDAGADWRHAGCSMCLGMNDDRMTAGERSISTSNRNFPGRQGPGSRTHLGSPEMVAASAILGRLAEPRDLTEAS